MKIITPGRAQNGWSTTALCSGGGNGGGGCGARLLVEQGDLFLTYRHARDETDTFVTFKCAACGVLTDLTDRQRPPSHVVQELKPQWRSA